MDARRFVASWSGGKDSCYAVLQARRRGLEPALLLSVLNEEGRISRAHGIPRPVLEQQARALGVPLVAFPSSWSEYERRFVGALEQARLEHGVTHAVFGDIDFEPHRAWEEKVCARAGLEPVLPLWKEDRAALVRRMVAEGLEAVIVSCNPHLGPGFLGRTLSAETVADLEAAGADPCGENGEYHTLVLNCPLFAQRLEVGFGDKRLHGEYWFLELLPAAGASG